MTINDKNKSSFYGALIIICALSFAAPALAATNNTSFDPSTGILSITGNCSGRYVLILIKNSSNGGIWGSSNPMCVNGAYSYNIAVPDTVRTGNAFSVTAMDNGTSPLGSGASQAVMFTPDPNIDQTAISSSVGSPTITLDTSTLDVGSSDPSFFGGMMQGLFGIVSSAANDIESSVVAAVHLFAKIFTVLPGGSINVPSGQNEISGQGVLTGGAMNVFIANTSISSSSQIILTPTSPTQFPLSIVQIQAGVGFEVGIVSPQQQTVSFTWLIINTYPDASSTGGSWHSQGGGFGNTQSFIATPPAAPTTTVSTSDDASSTDATSTTTSTDVSSDNSSSDSTSTDATTISPTTPDDSVITPTSTDDMVSSSDAVAPASTDASTSSDDTGTDASGTTQ